MDDLFKNQQVLLSKDKASQFVTDTLMPIVENLK